MGLDITAYSGLVKAEGNEAFDETGELQDGWIQIQTTGSKSNMRYFVKHLKRQLITELSSFINEVHIMNTHGMITNSAHVTGGIGFWLALAIAAAMTYGVISSLHDALSLPVVQRSTSTGECVHVLSDAHVTCDRLPKRYSVEWVE
jgi:hypothetical protein